MLYTGAKWLSLRLKNIATLFKREGIPCWLTGEVRFPVWEIASEPNLPHCLHFLFLFLFIYMLIFFLPPLLSVLSSPLLIHASPLRCLPPALPAPSLPSAKREHTHWDHIQCGLIQISEKRLCVWTALSPIVPIEQQRARWDPWVWSL